MGGLGSGIPGLDPTPRSTSFIDASSSGFLSESARYALLLKTVLEWFDLLFVSRRILKIRQPVAAAKTNTSTTATDRPAMLDD